MGSLTYSVWDSEKEGVLARPPEARPAGSGAAPKSAQAARDMRQSGPAALQVLKRLPNLKKLDGAPVEVEEREAALVARA